MKKFVAVLSAAAMMTSLAACGSTADTTSTAASSSAAVSTESTAAEATTDAKSYKIAVVQQLDHASLDEIRTAVEAELDAKAAEKGITIEYKDFNGQNDATTLNQIGTQVVSDGYDAIIPIATLAAQCMATAAESTKTPVIYAAISDPAAADLTDIDYVTGTSDALPVAAQLATIRALLPDAKKIGILYTTSEVNSLSTIETYKSLAPDYGFEIVESGINTLADVDMAAADLAAKVDCISNLTDNTVVQGLQTVLAKASAAGIPVFGSEVEQVKNGCLAAEGIDYVALGKQTGAMAAKVLKGEAEASDMPYEACEGANLYINTEVASDLGITFPENYEADAAEVFETVTVE